MLVLPAARSVSPQVIGIAGHRRFVGFANYTAVFQDSQFWTTALNTVIMTVGSVLIAMLIGIGLALILDRKFIGRGIVRTLLITPFLVMPVAAALLWKAVLNSFGAAAGLMAAGGIDTGPMLGPPFALDQFPEALASVRSGEGIKIQVAPGG